MSVKKKKKEKNLEECLFKTVIIPYKSACLFSGLERSRQLPFTAFFFYVSLLGFFTVITHHTVFYFFSFPAEELLGSRLCFLIFSSPLLGTVPFTNPCCALLEIEQGFTEPHSFLGAPSPVLECLCLVSHFGDLVSRLQH